jgi:hypothetical protein
MPAVLLGLGLALAPLAVAGAEEPPAGRSQEQSPSDLARDGLEQMMRALGLLVKSIPQYELPEVLDNGDIIIRRKDPARKPGAEEPEMDETST